MLEGQVVCSRVCKELVSQAIEKAAAQKFINDALNPYSSERLIHIVSQLGNQLLFSPPSARQLSPDADIDPPHIGEFPVSCIPNNHTDRKQQSSIKSLKSGQRGVGRGEQSAGRGAQSAGRGVQSAGTGSKSDIKRPALEKLEERRESEDNQIDRVRQYYLKSKEEKKVAQSKAVTKMHKLQLPNFDYDGKLIKINPKGHRNLVESVLGAGICLEGLKDKQRKVLPKSVHLEVRPIPIDADKLSKARDVPKIRSKRKAEQNQKQIQFSHITNPIELIEVKHGVRATFNETTQESKNKEKPPSDLQNKLGSNISRQEYMRLQHELQQRVGDEQRVGDKAQQRVGDKAEQRVRQEVRLNPEPKNSMHKVKTEGSALKSSNKEELPQIVAGGQGKAKR